MSKRKPINNFVVYLYLDEFGIPFYVGKGRPDRPYQDRGRACKTPPYHQIHILYTGLDEETAFAYEMDLIHEYGRECVDPDGGLLKNITSGGGGASGSGKPKNWFHVEHGLVQQVTITELVSMYPNQNLSLKSLSAVVIGVEKREHKGWVSVDSSYLEGDIPQKKMEEILRQCYINGEVSGRKVNRRSGRRTWRHPEHGLMENITSSELIDMFPDQKLSHSCLSSIATGKNESCKKWKVDPLVVEGSTVKKTKVIDISTWANYKPYDWCHVSHGYVPRKSCSELMRDFNDGTMSGAGLSALATGITKYHSGWVHLDSLRIDPWLDEDELKEKFSPRYAQDAIYLAKEQTKLNSYKTGKENFNYKSRNWCNTEVGFVPDKSISELVSECPDQKLSRGCLTNVASGKRIHHKGWVYILEDLIDKNLSKEKLCKIFTKEYAIQRINKSKYFN